MWGITPDALAAASTMEISLPSHVHYLCEACDVAGYVAVTDMACWLCGGPVKRISSIAMRNPTGGFRLCDLNEPQEEAPVGEACSNQSEPGGVCPGSPEEAWLGMLGVCVG